MRPDARNSTASRLVRLGWLLLIVLVSGLVSLGFAALARDLLHQPPVIVTGGFSVSWIVLSLVALRLTRAHERDREQCREVERSGRQANRVAQLTAALSHARTRRAAIEAAVQEPLHALGADAGMLLLVGRDGEPAGIARAVGYAEGEEPAATPGIPVTDAIGRGAAVFAPRTAAVPLLVGSSVVAVVQLDFRKARIFDEYDREYLDVLARRGAQAIDRTSEFESALQARIEADALRARADQELSRRQAMEGQLRASEVRYRTLAARTSRLHGLAAALSEAATQEAVARAVVEHGCNVLGAKSGEVLLLAGDEFRVLHSDVPAVQTRPATFAAGPGLCGTEAVRRREAVFVSSFEEWQEHYPRSASLAADGGFASSATLPLIAGGAAIGVLAFYFTAPVNFDEEYRGLLESVGQHCEQALERARLYEAAQRARSEAEQANRLKDKFVSVVSHELRTPLNAILGWTSLLQQHGNEEDMLERGLRAIHDNTTRQARLVEDLLDFSRLQAGRLALELEDVDLRVILRGVVETIVPSATAHQLHLDVAAVPPLLLRADPRRLEQIFLNLLGNAVKFTPAGGRIRVTVQQLPGCVEVRIADSGEGIDPAFIPYLFDAFRQAETTQRSRGVGLGLAIARELVEAHKGRIGAMSDGMGHGSTFVVTLPTAESELPSAVVVH